MSFLMGFLVDFRPNLMPKWSQVGTKVEAKTDINRKTPKSAKHYKTQWCFNSFGVRGVRFEDQHRWQIDQKTESASKCVFASSFCRFLVDFGSILAPNSTTNRFGKPSEKRPRKKEGREGPRTPSWVDEGDQHLPFGTPGGGRGRVNPPPEL